MFIKNYGYLLLFLSCLSGFGCSRNILLPKYEFRGVWIATVNNIDWPSSTGLSTKQQKNEIYNMLDFHQLNGINAVVMQVRPAADAFYLSKYEPWSQWLRGTQGRGPVPFYDPLTFFIDECHSRGMEFHAWFNPYRAVVKPEETITDSLHITRMVPEWFVRYGDRTYFDPGIPAVRIYMTNVVLDVLDRYDIDAVHFDDYFYPYKIAGLDFPDSASYAQYGEGFAHIEDWRRNNVDLLIRMLSDSIRTRKPHVKFGISPFGVWRNQDKDPKGSATRAGQTNYDDLYADVLKWLKEGWIDYIAPQIYWYIGFELADYKELVDWWSRNSYGRHVYIGQATYRINGKQQAGPWKKTSEMPSQLRLNRGYKEIQGSIFFSSRSLLSNPLGISDSLRTDFYRYPSLIPPMAWKDSISPSAPDGLVAKPDNKGILLTWNKNVNKDVSGFVIYRFKGEKVRTFNDPANILAVVPEASSFYLDVSAIKGKKYTYVITAIDRLYNESKSGVPVTVKVKI